MPLPPPRMLVLLLGPCSASAAAMDALPLFVGQVPAAAAVPSSARRSSNLTCAAGGTAADDMEVLNLTLGDAAAWCGNQTACAGFAAHVPYPASCGDTSPGRFCH